MQKVASREESKKEDEMRRDDVNEKERERERERGFCRAKSFRMMRNWISSFSSCCCSSLSLSLLPCECCMCVYFHAVPFYVTPSLSQSLLVSRSLSSLPTDMIGREGSAETC